MAEGKQDFPLSITLRTVDKTTAGIQKFNANIERSFKPYRNFGKELGSLSENLGLGKVRDSIGQVAGHVKNLVVGLTAAGAAATLAGAHIFKGWVEEGDKLSKTAERLGVTVDALAGLRFAAEGAGVEAGEFDSAISQLSKRLGELKAGAGPLKGAFDSVFTRQLKGAKNTEQALGLIADAMVKVKDPTTRAAIANTAFGRAGAPLINMLTNGSRGLEGMKKRYLELAGSQEGFAKTSADVDDAFDEVGAAMQGVRAVLVDALGPAVKDIAVQFRDFLVANRERIGEWAKEFAAKIPSMVDKLGEMLDKFKEIWDSIGGAKGALAIFAGVKLAPLASSVVSLVGSLVQMVAAIKAANVAAGVGSGAAAAAGGVGGLAKFAPLAGKAGLVGLAGAAGLAIGTVIAKKTGIAQGFMDPASRSGWASDLGVDDTPLPPRKSEAHVRIDFANTPKNVRASIAPMSSADVDLNVGYGMSLP